MRHNVLCAFRALHHAADAFADLSIPTSLSRTKTALHPRRRLPCKTRPGCCRLHRAVDMALQVSALSRDDNETAHRRGDEHFTWCDRHESRITSKRYERPNGPVTECRLQTGQNKRKKLSGRYRRKESKGGARMDRQRPNKAREKLFKDAGLPSKGFWTPSQKNKAKRLGQIELDPGQQDNKPAASLKCIDAPKVSRASNQRTSYLSTYKPVSHNDYSTSNAQSHLPFSHVRKPSGSSVQARSLRRRVKARSRVASPSPPRPLLEGEAQFQP